MAYRIQKLKLGGILDQAVAIVRDHFGLLFGILLFVFIPFHIIEAVITLTVLPQRPPNATMADLMAYAKELGDYRPLTIGLAVVQLLIVLPLTNAAVIYAVAEKYLGRPCTPGQAFKKGLSRVGALIGTAILLYLAVLGGTILCVIPGILFALWFGLSQHVVILEDLSGTAALTRSKTLVRPNLGTFLILGIIVFVIALLLGMGAGMIPQPHVQQVLIILLNIGITLFSTAAFVVFYFSCRCSVENFDLEHLAASIDQVEPPADSDVPPDPFR